MYNKKKPFKPKKMILNGQFYDVDSLETLDKIRFDIEQQKHEKKLVLEEQRNQKVLVRRIRTSDNNDTVIKEIRSIEELEAVKNMKQKQATQIKTRNRIEARDKKPVFSMVAQTGVRKAINNPITLVQSNESHKEETVNVPITKPKSNKPLNMIRHDQSPIKKLNNTDMLTMQQDDFEEEQVKEEPKGLCVVTTKKAKPLNKTKEVVEVVEDDKVDDNKEESVQKMESNPDAGYYTQNFPVAKQQWYVMIVLTYDVCHGLIKIIDDNNHTMMPTAKINNDMFVSKKYESSVEYKLFFQTKSSKTVDVHILGLNVKDVKIQQTTFEAVIKGIDVWKFRKYYDLEFLEYYMQKVKLNCNDKFIEKFKADLELYKNPNCLDTYVKNIKVDKRTIRKRNNTKDTVLYLLSNTVEYEQSNYSIRSHSILKHANDKYAVYGISRYGYPNDKEATYYNNQPIDDTFELDGVEYIKLVNNKESLNTLNILDYIKKYIYATIKMALETDAKIIHACSNYWNGLAGYYAAKYLGIKSVYEVRTLWDDNITLHRPEIKNTDLTKMMNMQESKILNGVDLVITTGQTAKDRLVDVDENKIKVVHHGVDTTLFAPENADDLKEQYGIKSDDIVLGYIGNYNAYEGLNNIIKCMTKWNNKNVKLVFVGVDPSKVDCGKVEDQVVFIDKVNFTDVHKYYNLIDIMVYPRLSTDITNTICSTKVLEAMAMEKAIVITDLDPLLEVIVDNKTGLVAKNDDIDDLTEKLESLIGNKDLRLELGKNAREWVKENRELSVMVKGLEALYDSLLSE